MSKKNFIFLIIFLVVFGFLIFNFRKVEKVEAGATDNVRGWAWSETIGWISFNRINCDADDNGFSDGIPAGCPPAGTPIPNYGVDIDNVTGNFSGFAWSENIGWIRFDPPAPYPFCPPSTCPTGSPGYSARLNLVTRKVTGWARACAGTVNGDCVSATRTDGWDGWILLGPIVKGGTDYGVYWDLADNQELKGWAWGSDVVGWISFNRVNCDPDRNGFSNGIGNCPPAGTPIANYKVIASLANPPQAEISCHPDGCALPAGACTGYTQTLFCLKNDSTDPDGDIATSTWVIRNSVGAVVNTLECSGLCNWTLPSTFSAGNYTAELTVRDTFNFSDTETSAFTILQDIIADFSCALGPGGPWKDCQGFNIAEGTIVYFNDESTPSTGASLNSWSWQFVDGTPAASTLQNPSASFEWVNVNSGTVTLTVTDTAGRSDSQTYQLRITLPLPEWKEVTPR
jgi:hypothetical protein